MVILDNHGQTEGLILLSSSLSFQEFPFVLIQNIHPVEAKVYKWYNQSRAVVQLVQIMFFGNTNVPDAIGTLYVIFHHNFLLQIHKAKTFYLEKYNYIIINATSSIIDHVFFLLWVLLVQFDEKTFNLKKEFIWMTYF